MINIVSFQLDCWDGIDGEPLIYHGWTLTSRLLFKDVLFDAIKPYAFIASDYPLILFAYICKLLEILSIIHKWMTIIHKNQTCIFQYFKKMLLSGRICLVTGASKGKKALKCRSISYLYSKFNVKFGKVFVNFQ